MSVDELWAVHEEVHEALFNRINSEKQKLEGQLSRLQSNPVRLKTHTLDRTAEPDKIRTGRRPYPKVLPKYRNPQDPSETWAGRGKKPLWVVTELSRGKKLEDFAINAKRPMSRAKRRN
jgi:DNA-binding protein H-NS